MISSFFKKKSIPVLCYHSMTADTDTYQGNDHIALASDLETLKKHQYRAISLSEIIAFAKGEKEFKLKDKVFALTFDDAPILDYKPYKSPTLGIIKPFKDILIDSGLFQQTAAVSFAIASEAARNELDKTCMQGKGDWKSEWWQEAIKTGLFEIANHSLDHLHSSLEKTQHSRLEKGNFLCVDNYEDANTQIVLAQKEINHLSNSQSSPYFAYPYGDVPNYLKDIYFPNYKHQHKLVAAFNTDGKSVFKGDNIWALPRLVCGQHWKSPKEFLTIINQK